MNVLAKAGAIANHGILLLFPGCCKYKASFPIFALALPRHSCRGLAAEKEFGFSQIKLFG
jgi:hypothetical protein